MPDRPAARDDGPLVAALPMYDFPELQADNDTLWETLSRILIASGVADVPGRLIRPADPDDLWQDPRLLLAQACEYPIATDFAGAVRLVATPCYQAPGCSGPLYRSAVVVRRDETAGTLADMRGRRCVINDRRSNSGMNLLRAAIAPLAGGERFFEDVAVSLSHQRSVEMVAGGEADLAAIDCVTFAHLRNFAPEHTGPLRVLCWTEPSPGLPFVTASRTDEATIRILRSALTELIADPDLRPVRERLLLVDFDYAPDERFTRVLGLARRAGDMGYPHLA